MAEPTKTTRRGVPRRQQRRRSPGRRGPRPAAGNCRRRKDFGPPSDSSCSVSREAMACLFEVVFDAATVPRRRPTSPWRPWSWFRSWRTSSRSTATRAKSPRSTAGRRGAGRRRSEVCSGCCSGRVDCRPGNRRRLRHHRRPAEQNLGLLSPARTDAPRGRNRRRARTPSAAGTCSSTRRAQRPLPAARHGAEPRRDRQGLRPRPRRRHWLPPAASTTS